MSTNPNAVAIVLRVLTDERKTAKDTGKRLKLSESDFWVCMGNERYLGAWEWCENNGLVVVNQSDKLWELTPLGKEYLAYFAERGKYHEAQL